MLRALVYGHVLWVAVAGMMIRGVIPYPDGRLCDSLIMAAFVAFPICIVIAARRSALSRESWCGLVVVEAGLTVAYMLAILPGVQ